jgi:iron-sulfur cluster assembly accessory protein
MSYSLTIEDETDEDDILITLEKVNVYVDPHSAGILKETVVDYVKTLQTEGFVFNNPKANTTCGCGMSFS